MIHAAVQAVNPYIAVRNRLRLQNRGSPHLVVQRDGAELSYNLSNFDIVKIFAFGKASAAMALAAAEITQDATLSSIALGGIVIIKDDHATSDEIQKLQNYNIAVRSASHPIPDIRSVHAADELLSSASLSDSRTLLIVCISGGGSSLFCSPREPLSLQDLIDTNSSLLRSGMPIDKMNIVRKRLENGKGGRLAAIAYPATVLTLILSDIIGDPLDLIASGPTVADGSDWKDAVQIVREYGLDEGGDHELPVEVLKLLQMGKEGLVEDTPKEDNPAFSRKDATSTSFSENVLVGNNHAAVMAAADEANQLGYHPIVLGTRIEGEASCIAGVHVAMAEMLSQQRGNNSNSRYPMAKDLPVALIAGGETTVTLPPDSRGKGGRNQELALAAAIKMQEIGLRDVVLASVGTDGTDGPTGKCCSSIDRIDNELTLTLF
jgi:glycerate-2-kinase